MEENKQEQLELRIKTLEDTLKEQADAAEKAKRDEKYRLSMLGAENMRFDFSPSMYLLPSDPNLNDFRLQQVANNNCLMLDRWGIHPDFIKCFPNVINNNSFEWYDPATGKPMFWQGEGVVTDAAAYDGTYSLKLEPGQKTEQGSLEPLYPGMDAGADPVWWSNFQTRCSFRQKGGAVRVRINLYGGDSEQITTVPEGWIGIYTAEDLQNIDGTNGNYIQMADIDLAGLNWEPLMGIYHGEGYSPFEGAYNGNGYKISNLEIEQSERFDSTFKGLFAMTINAVIENVTIENVNFKMGIERSDYCGAMVAQSMNGTVIKNCQVKNGTIYGKSYSGAIVGMGHGTTIEDCTVENVNIYGQHSIGVFAGSMEGGIKRCGAKGKVVYHDPDGETLYWFTDVGGFIGSFNGTIEDCYFNGEIIVDIEVGEYNWGTVGGFAHDLSGDVINCYSACKLQIVPAEVLTINGFVGYDQTDAIVNSYYDISLAGYDDDSNAIAKTTAEMTYPYSGSVYEGWDFEAVWTHDTGGSENNGYPYFFKGGGGGGYLLTDNSEEGLIDPFGNPVGVIRQGYELDYPYIENWAEFVDGGGLVPGAAYLVTGYRTFYFQPEAGKGKVKFVFENIDPTEPVYIDMVQMHPDFTGKWGMFETLGKRSIAPGDVIGMPGLGHAEVVDSGGTGGRLVLKPNEHSDTHATGGRDELTPEDIGAETPDGAQTKADAAESNANAYTDQEIASLDVERKYIEVIGGAGGISAFQAVYITLSDTAQAANAEEPSHIGRVVGMAVEAIAEDENGKVQLSGKIENAMWNLTPGSAYFLSSGGDIADSPPVSGFIQRMGVAKSATVLLLNIGEPILL